ncbi:WGxxGxxG family protein [Bacillus wiedmannii]|uniref:GNAT family acetyltransferase n=1 Tax=Bacillus wiedmannii TaxID=1890302 RepID=A0A2B5ID89_9BACI|nr:WGxxGxxG family protein [Bacillus wiedmannii]PEI62720.1 GNAT family acetyltransferase [Bacillus wiedmannii]PEL52309.1 GNAT family acetyltransferase [Bacillus wiedmannii]PEO08038.1 GNAT family acetyltransferase [Bacillus wiedmannii]PEQ04719.1 GNAT family acetyltransferase [Bacillus wiedmannii]PEU21904.1 GNAT family acetyltransferase [Bacillus wiedmannii]
MKKKLSSILSVLALSIMFLGTSAQAEYDGNHMNRVNNTDMSTRVNDNNLNRVNNDVRTRVNDNNLNRVNNDVRTRNVNTTNDINNNHDRNNNWAWLGLLGLAGLLGLRRRDKEVR